MTTTQPTVERLQMDVDIVCVGFGLARGGFLTPPPPASPKTAPQRRWIIRCEGRIDGGLDS